MTFTTRCQSSSKIFVHPLKYINSGKFTPLRVSENIGTGNLGEIDEMSSIEQAAKDGGADPFIQKLPRQYDTKLRAGGINRERLLRHNVSIGRTFRRRGLYSGLPSRDEVPDSAAPVDLSGGQWQRIALSRAFMRASSADLLILDEPSSSLDPEAEHNLFRYIQQVRRNKTTIYITHRFYTVRMATKIAFLEEGKLIEWGGHDELMGVVGGKYAKLYQLQSEGFSSMGQEQEAGELTT
jgi:ATP-binding cassette subfamily B protein